MHQCAWAVVALAGVGAAAFGQWSADPAENLRVSAVGGDQTVPKVEPIAGGSWIGWYDNRGGGYSVYVQRVDGAGVPQLAANGRLIVQTTFSSIGDFSMSADGAGNLVVAINDNRTTDQPVRVFKVGQDGTMLWGDEGVAVSTLSGFKSPPKVAALPDGSAAALWTQSNIVHVQRVSSAGAVAWASPWTWEDTGRAQTASDLRASNDGAVIALWVRNRTTNFMSEKGLRAQKLSAEGALVWGAAPVVVLQEGAAAGSPPTIQNGYFPSFQATADGGAVFSWYEISTTRESKVQHVLPDGQQRFAQNGIAVSNAPFIGAGDPASRIRLGVSCVYDAAADAYYAAWTESNGAQSQWGLRVQKLSGEGVREWGDNGQELLGLSGLQNSWARAVGLPGGGVRVFAWPGAGARGWRSRGMRRATTRGRARAWCLRAGGQGPAVRGDGRHGRGDPGMEGHAAGQLGRHLRPERERGRDAGPGGGGWVLGVRCGLQRR